MKTIHCGSLKHFSENYHWNMKAIIEAFRVKKKYGILNVKTCKFLNGFNNILLSNRSLVNDLVDCEKHLLLTNINFILYITRLQLIKTSRI